MNRKWIASLSLALCTPFVQATPVSWAVLNAHFIGGGTVSGSFIYDADTGAYSNVALATFGGASLHLGYDAPYSFATANQVTALRAADGPDFDGDPSLSLSFAGPLTNAGGWVPLVLTFASSEGHCFSSLCGARIVHITRVLESGMVFGTPQAVPEPAALALLPLGLLALGVMRRRRQAAEGQTC